MRTTKIIILSSILLISFGLRAQGVDDAILYSQIQYEGTARSMAMGNATGAMGGDITSACINPAGLGLYRSSEFTFSLGPQYHFCLTDYYGDTHYTQKLRATIPSLSLVFTSETSNYRPLRYFQIGIGMTRTNEFSYRQKAQGLNPASSMVDSYIQTLGGIDEMFNPNIDPGRYLKDNYPYDLSLAWETYLIDRYYNESGELYFDSPVPQGNVWQTDNVTSRGRSEEWTLALAANYYDKLFLGASVGLAHIRRTSTRTYEETPVDGNSNFFDWEHVEELGDTAWGVNGKVGLIYYPVSWLRVGVAWHSPTKYSVGERWQTETQTNLKGGDGEREYYKSYSPSLDWSYDFYTPHTFIGSLAFIIGQHGMVTTDVEYMNYGQAKFKFNNEYQYYDDVLNPTFNMRFGLEWRFRQVFARCGTAYYGSPYGFGKTDGSAKKLALGLGYAASESITWDFAYELSHSTSRYTPYQYDVNGENVVEDAVRRQWRNKLVVTLKIRL